MTWGTLNMERSRCWVHTRSLHLVAIVESTRCLADPEREHDVNAADLAFLANDFNRTDCSKAHPCSGDINGDGVVDTDDLSTFASEFGKTVCPDDQFYYFHNDHLGTPQRITDQTGSVAWSANYKPFGEATITANIISNPFRFPGQYYDQETGLHYNYHRYYDPGTGRYLTPDPIGLRGGINLFAFVLNNPINLINPYGLLTEVVVWQPVGWGQSSFGHVSVNINGTTYSYSPSGMHNFDTKDYLSRNAFREGVGSELNLSPCEEEKLEDFLKKYQESYFFPFTTYATPIQEGLKKLGYDLGLNLHPVSLGYSLMDSGLINNYNFYDATVPRQRTSAPWAK